MALIPNIIPPGLLNMLNNRLKWQDPDFILKSMGPLAQRVAYDKNTNTFGYKKSNQQHPYTIPENPNPAYTKSPKPKEELKARRSLIDWADFGESLMDMAQQNNQAYEYDIFGED